MRLRALSSIIALNAFAALTGCGGGGGASDPSQHVDQPPPRVIVFTDPQGLWQGSTTQSNGSTSIKTVSGVVTKEGDYWFAYTYTSGQTTASGFFSGLGTITPTTAPNGKFTSANLRDLNFTTHAALAGTISIPTGMTENYVAKSTLNGSLDPVIINLSTYNISGSFPVTAMIFGNPLTVPFTVNNGTYDSVAGTGSWNVTGDVSAMGFGKITFDQTFTLNATTGIGNLDVATNCQGNGIACNGVGPNFNGPINAGGPIVAGTQSWTVTTPQFGSPIFAPVLSQNLLPTITADTFQLTYNSAYETAPDLATLTGNYTGAAGVGTEETSSQQSATFNIDSTGAISGDAIIGSDSCHFSGNASVHASGGNVYDVALAVTPSTNSTCTEATGSFSGVAILENKKITVMAVTTASQRDAGVLFVGTKP